MTMKRKYFFERVLSIYNKNLITFKSEVDFHNFYNLDSYYTLLYCILPAERAEIHFYDNFIS